MAISINPYQSNNYWYERDNSVTSSPSPTAQPSTVSKSSKVEGSQPTQSDETKPSVVVHLSGKAGKELELSEQELKLINELQKSDTEVRAHEMSHVAAGGQYVTSGAQLEYRKGPDGKRYAVAGEVSIDTSAIAGDPQATIEKMHQVQRAALAPASPSSQDRKVAASAGALAADALSELIMLQAEERTQGNESKAFGSIRQAADSYSKVNNLPIEPQMSSFKIAV
ncbi:MAG: SprA-related family protein [Desulfamplus sp.]|nr:SprA-related family protein [Desulfamplus sp.]MBF0413953.1 SprA-related family protein [Desulfamplus sp.]